MDFDIGMGIGDFGFGIGPNPQSSIPTLFLIIQNDFKKYLFRN